MLDGLKQVGLEGVALDYSLKDKAVRRVALL
jgi:hypothetical protein